MKTLPNELLEAKNINSLFFEFSDQLQVFPNFNSLTSLQELEIFSSTFYGDFKHAHPERIKEMIQTALSNVHTLTIRKFKKLPLACLTGIAQWKGLKTLILDDVDLIFKQKDFIEFVNEINNSTIETIKIPATINLIDFKYKNKELQDYLTNKKVGYY